jgi:hypothetical protein
MEPKSMQIPARQGRILFRTGRAVGRWFSRVVNALGQPSAHREGDHWDEWPRFPPF